MCGVKNFVKLSFLGFINAVVLDKWCKSCRIYCRHVMMMSFDGVM